MEGSFFNAYKVTNGGANAMAETKKTVFSSMVLIDNSIGVAVSLG